MLLAEGCRGSISEVCRKRFISLIGVIFLNVKPLLVKLYCDISRTSLFYIAENNEKVQLEREKACSASDLCFGN